MISIIVVHARNIANILKHAVEVNVLIQTMIRGIVESAIIVVKLVNIVSMECAMVTHKILFIENPI